MRIWLEVVGIPEESREDIRRTVHEAYRTYLCGNGTVPDSSGLDIRGGTCPFTGRGYLSVRVHFTRPMDLQALQQFADAIHSAHPMRDDAVVRANRSVRIEDSTPEDVPILGLDEKGPPQEDVSCWVCGRFDGEEYRDHGIGDSRILEVQTDTPGGVPLCAVCRMLFEGRRRAP